MNSRERALLHGLLAGMGLLLVYVVIVSLAQSFSHAVEEFLALSYLMVPLMAGFGTQVSLFSYSRQYVSAIHQGSASVTASGGVSTASMIACCAHHITNILPFIGATVAATFLTTYQAFFIEIGLLSNMVGITVMLAIMQRHQLYHQEGAFARLMKLNLMRVRNIAIVVSVVAIIPIGLATAFSTSPAKTQNVLIPLPEKVNSANGLTVAVTP